MGGVIGWLVMPALLTSAMPPAAPQASCLPRGEAQALFVFLMPTLLERVRGVCAQAKPDGFLAKSGPALLATYRKSADAAWPAARRAFGRFVEGKYAGELDKLPAETVRPLIEAGLSVAIAKDIKPETCPAIDRLAESLAPLPPENIGALFGSIVELRGAARSSGSGRDFPPVCEAAGS